MNQIKVNSGKGVHIALWSAQWLLSAAYCAVGLMKLLTPIHVLASMMPWMGQVPEVVVRSLGLIDLAGSVGIVLPALTRVFPELTVWAASGCTVLQMSAIAFHVSRGEAAKTPLNLVLLALSSFILWGRWTKAPIEARSQPGVRP